MKPTFFANTNGRICRRNENGFSRKSNGLWQAIIPFDIDNDGIWIIW
jgi:hypothetical protein